VIIVAVLASIAAIMRGVNGLSRIRLGIGGARSKIAAGVLLSSGSLGLCVSGWLLVDFGRQLLALGYLDSAIVSMRALVDAETQFARAHPEVGYTCTLSVLPGGEPVAGLVKNSTRNGYTFEISGCRTHTAKHPNLTYQVTARPNNAKMPAFCSDESGILRLDPNGSVSKCLKAGEPW
jgi:hypothetical protein